MPVAAIIPMWIYVRTATSHFCQHNKTLTYFTSLNIIAEQHSHHLNLQ